MSRKAIPVGTKFGRLTVNKVAYVDKHKHRIYECTCSCGNITYVASPDLRSGATTSCGCYKKEMLRKKLTKHGGRRTRLYACWTNMKARCYNTKTKNYKYYGGKGIEVCDEWLESFTAFKKWALKHGYRDDLTIDRIDPDGNYEPNNCRWITQAEQQKNKSNSILIQIGKVTKPLVDWSEELHINYSTLMYRYQHNWSGAELIRPVAHRA